MEFSIEPYVGVGPIRFEMTAAEVRDALGAPFRTFRKGPFAKADSDAFEGRGIHVHYSSEGMCEAVEFGESTIPTFEGHPLLGRPFQEVYELLKVRDPSLKVDDTGFTSFLLGVGIYMSALEDRAADSEGVIVFKIGYYD